ncbi:GNAT family N-acetyltransferase [Microbaculum marinum]|uniref:GNAT family N-acetyltransferase n=1 Tax=Microbaculum marinum TaxID=1764581 RepID=A0AAW9RZ82_9HYPH
MPEIRPARKSDALVLAYLIDLAGEGIPSYLWGQAAEFGETALDVGSRRAEREQGAFSYRNAYVVEVDGRPVSMLLGYRQPDTFAAGDLEEFPPFIRPMVELEAEAPGSWYVNALATLPEHQGRGYGAMLLDIAEQVAANTGATLLSIIVDSKNARAAELYRRSGYRERARRRILALPGDRVDGDWVLLVRPVTRKAEE